MAIGRFDVNLISLDPTVGSKIQAAQPNLVISPDEMHRQHRTGSVETIRAPER